MKKAVKILLGILLVILIIVGVIVYKQWDNLKALNTAMHTSKAEIAQQLEKNDEDLIKMIKETYGVDLNLDELKKANANGENLPDGEAANGNGGNKNDSNTSSNGGASSSTDVEAVITKYVNQIYSLKATYLGKINGLEGAIQSEWNALGSGQKNESTKTAIINKYYGYAAELERACDTKVDQVTSNMRADLKKLNQSTEIVDSVKSAYQKEKELKKAALLQDLKNQ